MWLVALPNLQPIPLKHFQRNAHSTGLFVKPGNKYSLIKEDKDERNPQNTCPIH